MGARKDERIGISTRIGRKIREIFERYKFYDVLSEESSQLNALKKLLLPSEGRRYPSHLICLTHGITGFILDALRPSYYLALKKPTGVPPQPLDLSKIETKFLLDLNKLDPTVVSNILSLLRSKVFPIYGSTIIKHISSVKEDCARNYFEALIRVAGKKKIFIKEVAKTVSEHILCDKRSLLPRFARSVSSYWLFNSGEQSLLGSFKNIVGNLLANLQSIDNTMCISEKEHFDLIKCEDLINKRLTNKLNFIVRVLMHEEIKKYCIDQERVELQDNVKKKVLSDLFYDERAILDVLLMLLRAITIRDGKICFTINSLWLLEASSADDIIRICLTNSIPRVFESNYYRLASILEQRLIPIPVLIGYTFSRFIQTHRLSQESIENILHNTLTLYGDGLANNNTQSEYISASLENLKKYLKRAKVNLSISENILRNVLFIMMNENTFMYDDPLPKELLLHGYVQTIEEALSKGKSLGGYLPYAIRFLPIHPRAHKDPAFYGLVIPYSDRLLYVTLVGS